MFEKAKEAWFNYPDEVHGDFEAFQKWLAPSLVGLTKEDWIAEVRAALDVTRYFVCPICLTGQYFVPAGCIDSWCPSNYLPSGGNDE